MSYTTNRKAIGRFHSAFWLDKNSESLFCLLSQLTNGKEPLVSNAKNMIYNYKINRAVRFAIETHEITQKQKRKGKDIPYITHPLTVGLILSRAGADENTVIAGILHDTIEDSVPEKKVTKEVLEEKFGKEVSDLVESVTEIDKGLSWEQRKLVALLHIRTFSQNSLLVKSADVLSNVSELIEDHQQEGDAVFNRFNAPKDRLILNSLRVITALVERWKENPLTEDLRRTAGELQQIGAFELMSRYPAQIIEYSDYNENMTLQCSLCEWKGTPKESDWIEYYEALMDVSCPNCQKMLLVISYPMIGGGAD